MSRCRSRRSPSTRTASRSRGVSNRGWPTVRSAALCRCGKSGSKPLCDGSHMDVAFDGTETASFEPRLERAEVLLGPRVDVADAEGASAPRRASVTATVRSGTVSARTQPRPPRRCSTSAGCVRRVATPRSTRRPASRSSQSCAPSIAFVQDPHEKRERTHLGARRNRGRVRRRARVRGAQSGHAVPLRRSRATSRSATVPT